MKQKFQLRHPAGKKAVSMNIEKYDALKNALLNHLIAKEASTHTQIVAAITSDFKKNKVKFVGSLEWHLEWVKLDLEARKEIKRLGSKPLTKFAIGK